MDEDNQQEIEKNQPWYERPITPIQLLGWVLGSAFMTFLALAFLGMVMGALGAGAIALIMVAKAPLVIIPIVVLGIAIWKWPELGTPKTPKWAGWGSQIILYGGIAAVFIIIANTTD